MAMNSIELNLCISKVVIVVHFSVDIKHFLAGFDAEVFNAHILALEEGWEEVASDAVGIFSVEATKLFSVLVRCSFSLRCPLEHFYFV